ncbi:hypothetical protein [Salimicrobium album]|uniref:PH domain-containing protein n=1 Tax=Salimicrobium album TaxID=50717 RepID=A0A1H3D8W4_9BACI|nr:hypothetical protein [Salimicrobium album]SDX62174.1 hypothetical protein SAMN04488081_0855 [Salimicrobium album]
MSDAGQFIFGRMKTLDDDMTDIVFVDGEAFVIKRANEEDVKEWSGEIE